MHSTTLSLTLTLTCQGHYGSEPAISFYCRSRTFQKISLFSKILQPHLLSRNKAVTSYRRHHHGDASSALQCIHHINGKAQWTTNFTSPTRRMLQDEQT